jgi:RNA polymerase-binding transcription factor
MTNERYAHLKRILEDHRRRLQRSLAVRMGDVRAHNDGDRKAVEALDAADASASGLDQDFSIALAELAGQALRQVDRALTRLAGGDYGVCVDCDDAIAAARLRALPFAARCRDCQELHEVGERARRLPLRSHDSLDAYLERP